MHAPGLRTIWAWLCGQASAHVHPTNSGAERGIDHHSAYAAIGNDGGGGKANAEPDAEAAVAPAMAPMVRRGGGRRNGDRANDRDRGERSAHLTEHSPTFPTGAPILE